MAAVSARRMFLDRDKETVLLLSNSIATKLLSTVIERTFALILLNLRFLLFIFILSSIHLIKCAFSTT